MNSENISMFSSLSDDEKMEDVLSSSTRYIDDPVTSHILILPLACLEGEREGVKHRDTCIYNYVYIHAYIERDIHIDK